MGRELRRVPLDFKWPIDQLWKGYVNPYACQECKSCDRTGLNPATKALSDAWYSFDKARYISLGNGRRYNDNAWQYHLTELEVSALVESGRLMDFTHTWVSGEGWIIKEPAYTPTPEQVNDWAKKGMGHDSINQWVCVKARAESLGIYGTCEYCHGSGNLFASEEIEKLHEEWESFDPPTGDGFQLWNTTTEGHPMTPVFESLDLLCEYLAQQKTSYFGYQTATKEEWLQMLGDGLVAHTEGNMIFI